MFKIRRRKGLTLIELVVSMAIFGIIAVIFIPMFTSSLIWIYGAGNKGEAYSIAQEDIEGRIATGDSYYSDDISLTFDGKTYSIRGGLIETNQTVNNKNSNLKTFVPLLPTITLYPIVRYEGDPSTTVTINGIDTNFNASTIIEIFDAVGINKIGPTINPTINSTIEAVFDVPSNLLNNDYIIRVTTIISGEPNEVSRAKYRVEQSKFMAAGDNKVYISANGIDWLDRYSLPNITAHTDMKDITNNGIRYVIVGDNGNTLISNDSGNWVSKSILGSEDILAVTWSPSFSKFYATGRSGGLYSLDSSLNWTSLVSGTTNQIRGITSTSFTDLTNIENAVGENTILYSSNGLTWSHANITFIPTDPLDSYDLNSVATGNDLVVAVGDSGYIGRSINGKDWTVKEVLPHSINDIAYNRDINEFIVVGDNSLIMRSNDGETWTNIPSPVSENFKGVFTQGIELVIVGENGNILYADDINNISFNSSNVVDTLSSISGK